MKAIGKHFENTLKNKTTCGIVSMWMSQMISRFSNAYILLASRIDILKATKSILRSTWSESNFSGFSSETLNISYTWSRVYFWSFYNFRRQRNFHPRIFNYLESRSLGIESLVKNVIFSRHGAQFSLLHTKKFSFFIHIKKSKILLFARVC